MDKREAIEFLKKSLSGISHLAKLPYNNDDYPLWHKVIEGILEEVFGRDSGEYQNFLDATLKFSSLFGDAQKDYLTELKMRETALLSIIQKHEVLGIETEPATKAKPPDVIKDFEEKAGKELELTLDGTPDMIIECVMNFVKKPNSQGYTYECIPRIGGAPDFARRDKTVSARCDVFVTRKDGEEQIGTISLQLLSKEKTLLKCREPEDWGSSFGHFLNALFAELQGLGFVDFKEEKPVALVESLPKAFIAHGGDSPALRKLKSFLEALGVQPLVVEDQPSEGRSVGKNVDWYSKQADCAIILATKGDIDGKTGGFIPRGNVLMETGKLQEIFKDRIVYLLQAGTKFPTNISEKVRERFTSQNMDNAFIKIAKELKKFGILRAVKP